jgi:hypothetical protein
MNSNSHSCWCLVVGTQLSARFVGGMVVGPRLDGMLDLVVVLLSLSVCCFCVANCWISSVVMLLPVQYLSYA